MWNKAKYYFAFLVLAFSVCCRGAEIAGIIHRVIDGDTISLCDRSQTRHRIRLYGIDAPESSQSYGIAAKIFLSLLLKDKEVNVQVRGQDRYQRIIGIVWVDGRNINIAMVENGYAWHYHSFAKQAKDIARVQQMAKNQKRGLWHEATPIAPWNYRKSRR